MWIDGELFENQDIKLDFSRWNNCTFRNCTIIVKYGEFDLVGCHFDKYRLRLDGNAIAIAEMIRMFSQKMPDHKPNVAKYS
jgi:hypothetical protein